jgi:hypothetical protein
MLSNLVPLLVFAVVVVGATSAVFLRSRRGGCARTCLQQGGTDAEEAGIAKPASVLREAQPDCARTISHSSVSLCGIVEGLLLQLMVVLLFAWGVAVGSGLLAGSRVWSAAWVLGALLLSGLYSRRRWRFVASDTGPPGGEAKRRS